VVRREGPGQGAEGPRDVIHPESLFSHVIQISKEFAMKLSRLLLAVGMVFALAGCDQKPKSAAEQIKDKVNDALDRRPNEKLRDAAEDIRDGVKEAAKDLRDAAKHTGK
jgi:hypothetical protein